MRAAALLGAAIVVAGAATAGSVSAQPRYAMDPTKSFAQEASGSDQYEILAGRVALQEAQDPGVRDFAQMMIQDHTRTSQDLRTAVARSGREPPPMAMSGDQARLLMSLQSLRGADFDKAYMTQQVVAHTSALVVQQDYAAHGDDPGVRQVAQAAVPMIGQHLQQARQLKGRVGAP